MRSGPADADPLLPGDCWVRCARELVEQLSAEWSPPVEVRIAYQEGNVLDLALRTHTCGDPTQESA